MTTSAPQDISFEDGTPLTAVYGKFITIGDGANAKRNSKTDYRTSVIGRLLAIRPDTKFSKPDALKRLFDMVLDGGEVVTVTDSAALKGITTETIGQVVRITFTGYGAAKAGQEAPKQIEIVAKPFASLTAEQQARFQPVEDGDANEEGI